MGVIVRLGDKIQRLLSVSKNGVTLVDSESLRDTLIDLHNYAAMGVMLMDEEKDISIVVPENKETMNINRIMENHIV